jgi:hypothetical protein
VVLDTRRLHPTAVVLHGRVEAHAVHARVTTTGRLNVGFRVAVLELLVWLGFDMPSFDVDGDAEPHSSSALRRIRYSRFFSVFAAVHDSQRQP